MLQVDSQLISYTRPTIDVIYIYKNRRRTYQDSTCIDVNYIYSETSWDIIVVTPHFVRVTALLVILSPTRRYYLRLPYQTKIFPFNIVLAENRATIILLLFFSIFFVGHALTWELVLI